MNLQEDIQRIKEMMIMNESKGWGDSNQKLEKTFKFKDFNESIGRYIKKKYGCDFKKIM